AVGEEVDGAGLILAAPGHEGGGAPGGQGGLALTVEGACYALAAVGWMGDETEKVLIRGLVPPGFGIGANANDLAGLGLGHHALEEVLWLASLILEAKHLDACLAVGPGSVPDAHGLGIVSISA